MAGRNTKLDRRRINKIARVIGQGNTDIVACSQARISQATFYGWLKIAEDVKGKNEAELSEHEALCLEFLDAVTQARDKAEAVAVSAVWLSIKGFDSEEITEDTYYRTDKKTGELVPVTTRTVKRWHTAPNAQVALEFLSRRRRENWSKNPDVQITNNQLVITGDQLQAALLQAEQKQRELDNRYPELNDPDAD